MQKHKIIDGVPYITEYKVTVLVQDIPSVHTFYSEQEVISAIKRLQLFGKRYELSASLYQVH